MDRGQWPVRTSADTEQGSRSVTNLSVSEMKFENSNGHTKDWSDVNHNAEQRKVLPGRMSYITVTENAIKWWVTVNGLNHHEVRAGV